MRSDVSSAGRAVLAGVALTLVFAAGVLVGRSWSASPERPAPAPRKADHEVLASLRAELKRKEERIRTLEGASSQSEPEKHEKYDPIARIVYAKNVEFAEKLRQIGKLPDAARWEATERLGRELSVKTEMHKEILRVLSDERDPAVLALLGDVLRAGGMRSLTGSEIEELERVIRTSEAAGARSAAVRALALSHLEDDNPGWVEFLEGYVAQEDDPGVLQAIAEANLEADAVVNSPRIQEILLQKLPDLRGQEAYPAVLRFLHSSQKPIDAFRTLYERWAAEGDAETRLAICGVMVDVAERRVSVFHRSGSEGGVDGNEELARKVMDVYRGTGSVGMRARLAEWAHRLLRLDQDSWLAFLDDLLNVERNPQLRSGLSRLRSAVESGKARLLAPAQLRELIGVNSR